MIYVKKRTGIIAIDEQFVEIVVDGRKRLFTDIDRALQDLKRDLTKRRR